MAEAQGIASILAGVTVSRGKTDLLLLQEIGHTCKPSTNHPIVVRGSLLPQG
jgi:hypothetical protein